MAVNNILVTETTPKASRTFSIQRPARGVLRVVSEPNGLIALEASNMGLIISPAEAKALIEVLQELTQ